MRYIQCDICDSRTSSDAELIQMTVPGSWIGQGDENLEIDVCSPQCLDQVVSVLMGEQPEEPEPEPEPEPEGNGQIGGIQANPYRTIRLTPDESSELTGVKRKGVDR